MCLSTDFGLAACRAEITSVRRAFGGMQFNRAEAQVVRLVAEIEANVNGLAVDGQGDGLL